MPAIVNPVDFVKIAVIGYVFIWLVNQGLTKFGASQYAAGA